MWGAYSGDVVMEYAFGFNYNNLKSEDFAGSFYEAFVALTDFGSLACQFPMIRQCLETLPNRLVQAMKPPLGKVLALVKVT
jgi:hypothetical protein